MVGSVGSHQVQLPRCRALYVGRWTVPAYTRVAFSGLITYPASTTDPDDRSSSGTGSGMKETMATAAEADVYDVVICGTDLIQSILSSALSRAGKKVLHCDGNEWYGGFDAVLYGGTTLDLFIEGCEKSYEEDGTERRDEERMSDVANQLQLLQREQHGGLRLHSRSFVDPKESDAKHEVEDGSPSDADANIQKLSVDDDAIEKEEGAVDEDGTKDSASSVNEAPSSNLEKTGAVDEDDTKDSSSAMDAPSTQNPSINPMEHGFCFDVTPSLLYASGDAVDDLVKSGVSDYLEFKSLKGLYLLMEEEKSSTARGGRRSRNTGKSKSKDRSNGNSNGDEAITSDRKLSSYRVPCSKADVFRSKLLSPVDKRQLMKFLQLISDYGMATFASNELDDTTNESKPEEEGNESDGMEESKADVSGEDAIQSINERHLHRGRALSRPQNKATPSSSEMDSLMRCVRDDVSFSDFLTKVAKLPQRISTVVVYALALAPFGYLENKGSEEVEGAVNRISQYSTKDGVEDLVRHLTALGRFGDTAFLVPMYGSGELSQAFCRSGAVYGSTYMLRRSPLSISLNKDNHVEGVLLSGEEHIGGIGDLDTEDVSDRELSCKHVIVPSTMMAPAKGREVLQARTYRRVSILQGKLMVDQDQADTKDGTDTEQRYAIIIPPGTPGIENKSAIHGVAVDDSAFVAPARKNCTLLHLTTSSQGGDSTPDELFVDSLSKAVEYVIASQPTKEGDEPIKECHHVSFSFTTDAPRDKTDDETSTNQTPGLHVCYRDKQSLTCDSAFREAKRIFRDICPDSEFLAIAKKVEEAIVYREENDSDDEKMVLESACTMIQTPQSEEPPVSDDAETPAEATEE